MIIDNTIFHPGKVTYNSFSIDFNMPFSSQLDELNEDLIQVEFDKEFLLDIGWHPERDAKGRIIVRLIHGYRWDYPIIKAETIEYDELLNIINNIMTEIESITETGGGCH